jgi:hypothetical protein
VDGKNGTVTWPDLESALYTFGMLRNIEMLYMTIFLAVSIAGILLNIFSAVVFFRPAFYSSTAAPIFSYMRYEALIGVLGNAIETIYGINYCIILLSLVNNFTSQWIQVNIVIPVYNITYYLKFMIEIVIVVDRILILVPSITSKSGLGFFLKIKRPYLVLISICVFSVVIDYPYLGLLGCVSSVTIVNYPVNQVFTYWRTQKCAWGNLPSSGYYQILAMNLFKNVVTFFVETVLNMISVVLFRRHLSKKATLVGTNRSATTKKPSNTITKSLANTSNDTQASSSNGPSAGGRNMANLVIFKTVTGFFHNVILTTYTMWVVVSPQPTPTYRMLMFLSYFASTLRHSINYFQFYYFNTAFRNEARLLIQKTGLVGASSRVQPASSQNTTIHY